MATQNNYCAKSSDSLSNVTIGVSTTSDGTTCDYNALYQSGYSQGINPDYLQASAGMTWSTAGIDRLDLLEADLREIKEMVKELLREKLLLDKLRK